MLRHKALPMAISLLALGALATACGGGGGGGDGGGGEGTRVAASLYSRDVPYYQAVATGIEDQAKEYGWELNLNFSKPDPSEQTSAVETLLGTSPEGLIMVPIDGSAMIPAAKQALSQEIPVVVTGDDLTEESARSAYVGGDFEAYGRQKAEWIVKELGGKGQVGIVHGIRGITFTELQNKGAQEVFAENPGIEVIEGPYAGGFTAELGLQATENLITAHPEIEAIFFDNDDLALGGAQAARDRGIKADEILIVGTDGLEAGLAGLRKGEIDMTLAQCATDQGRQAVSALKKLIEGEEIESQVITPVYEVTPSTLEEYEENAKCKG